MPWSLGPQLQSLYSRAHEPQLLSPHTLPLLKPTRQEPMLHKRSTAMGSPHQDKEQPLLTTTRESLRAATKIHDSQKKKSHGKL